MDNSNDIGDDKPATATCLWCGAQRPTDVEICPTCQHSWIDATIDEARRGKLDTVVTKAPERARPIPWWRRKWLPPAIAAAAALVYGVVFWVMWDGTQPDSTAAPTTLVTTTSQDSSPQATTSPTLQSTTTSATTSTTTTTTSTTTTTTQPPIPEVPPALEIEELTLGAFALGPLRFGANNEAAGRLAATFGQPSERFPVGENWGLCPTDTGHVLRWGTLSIILREEPAGDVLVGFRHLDDPTVTDFASTALLRSLSGLALGDPLTRVRTLYANVATDTLDDGTPIFLVLRSSDRRTLLWGALSSDPDPLVVAINSPRPCDGGPFEP